MGDCPEPETTDEKIKTLRRMVAENDDRLSINERAAITFALWHIARAKKAATSQTLIG